MPIQSTPRSKKLSVLPSCRGLDHKCRKLLCRTTPILRNLNNGPRIIHKAPVLLHNLSPGYSRAQTFALKRRISHRESVLYLVDIGMKLPIQTSNGEDRANSPTDRATAARSVMEIGYRFARIGRNCFNLASGTKLYVRLLVSARFRSIVFLVINGKGLRLRTTWTGLAPPDWDKLNGLRSMRICCRRI